MTIITNNSDVDIAIATYHILGVFASVRLLIFSVIPAKVGFPVMSGGSLTAACAVESAVFIDVLTITF
jgi:hypothetical protein